MTSSRRNHRGITWKKSYFNERLLPVQTLMRPWVFPLVATKRIKRFNCITFLRWPRWRCLPTITINCRPLIIPVSYGTIIFYEISCRLFSTFTVLARFHRTEHVLKAAQCSATLRFVKAHLRRKALSGIGIETVFFYWGWLLIEFGYNHL